MSKMQSKQNYNKTNRKRSKKIVVIEKQNGELAKTNSGSKRNPIVSLPEIITSPCYQVYRRFITQGQINGTIGIFDMLNQFLVATTSILAYPYVSAVRIKKIRLLAPVTTQGSSVFVSMRPSALDSNQNSFNSVPELYIDSSASIDVPAYLSLTPSIDTPFGSWHRPINTNLQVVEVVAPAGSTMDILFEFIVAAASTAKTYSQTVSGAVAGNMYAQNMLTNFQPQGVLNI